MIQEQSAFYEKGKKKKGNINVCPLDRGSLRFRTIAMFENSEIIYMYIYNISRCIRLYVYTASISLFISLEKRKKKKKQTAYEFF